MTETPMHAHGCFFTMEMSHESDTGREMSWQVFFIALDGLRHGVAGS